MSIPNKKRIPLHRYWTSRYFLTLCIGLLVIGLLSVWWIRHTTIENRLNMMTLLTEDMANRIVSTNEFRPPLGKGVPGGFPDRRWMDLDSEPFIYIVDDTGRVVSGNRPKDPLGKQVDINIIASSQVVQKLQLGKAASTFYLVKAPISKNDHIIGWVLMLEAETALAKVNQEYTLLTIMIISLGLLGWGAIYFLTKRLSRPIKEVAFAAKQVQEGNYDVQLQLNHREAEIDELITSFKEMTTRLEQLESLRTQLLAGVTHELKTPVTSISGLLQAIDDKVVSGEEAQQFIKISLKETTKMKTMVEDLLAFNSFVAHAVPLSISDVNINQLLENIVYQWNLSEEESGIKTTVSLLHHDVMIAIDPLRLEQIILNLLHNSRQAIPAKLADSTNPIPPSCHATTQGEIQLIITLDHQHLYIDVTDNGSGIAIEEQPLIFERFYRGETKKYEHRGLGLGLPLSKMIAQAMNGDLCLRKSDSTGTTFRIRLVRNKALSDN